MPNVDWLNSPGLSKLRLKHTPKRIVIHSLLKKKTKKNAHLVVLVGLGLEVGPHPARRVVAKHFHAFELVPGSLTGRFHQER